MLALALRTRRFRVDGSSMPFAAHAGTCPTPADTAIHTTRPPANSRFAMAAETERLKTARRRADVTDQVEAAA
ncbi:hypothetical protein [Actinokineospora globicatena]|uniref:Uncharacterized protein n=1 Tax=Actinokineospora globicatena TaxID=103729 RepID=A0A9W6VA41_9PSEU|nr:hypothetical protein [Actinokineospora globicatena]GLW93932.1 hypothetical protein Aglo03_47480 [Actinokineospora globicatena]